MDYKQDEIFQELRDERANIQNFIQPFWYRCIRYDLHFCFLLFYSKSIKEEQCRRHTRETDSYIKLDKDLACIALEALDMDTAITLLERIFFEKEHQYDHENQEFYCSIVCSSQVKDEEEMINKSFMILEYAFEYKRKNEVLDFGVLPSK